MNMSLQDGHNIGWKLAMVLKGQASPDILKTYNLEREKTAADLIAFDRELTAIFSRKGAKDIDTLTAARTYTEHFIMSGKYTAGLTISYADSMITNAKGSNHSLAKNVTVGMRCPSAQVVRYCDARAMQLAKALQSTGQWRILVFGGDILDPESAERLDRVSGFDLIGCACS
jgi:phenol 2-monooxygenase (NADPH)